MCNAGLLLSAREGGRQLQSLPAAQRADIINRLAESLMQRQQQILEANILDLKAADQNGITQTSRNRLTMTSNKLKSLATGESLLHCFNCPQFLSNVVV